MVNRTQQSPRTSKRRANNSTIGSSRTLAQGALFACTGTNSKTTTEHPSKSDADQSMATVKRMNPLAPTTDHQEPLSFEAACTKRRNKQARKKSSAAQPEVPDDSRNPTQGDDRRNVVKLWDGSGRIAKPLVHDENSSLGHEITSADPDEDDEAEGDEAEGDEAEEEENSAQASDDESAQEQENDKGKEQGNSASLDLLVDGFLADARKTGNPAWVFTEDNLAFLADLPPTQFAAVKAGLKKIFGSHIDLGVFKTEVNKARRLNTRRHEQDQGNGQGEKKAESARDLLVRLGDEATLLRTTEGELYARVRVNGHYEVQTVGEQGSKYRKWLIYRFYQATKGGVPNATALTEAMSLLTTRAQFEGRVAKIHTRLAYGDDKNLYLDLGGEDWKAVKITPQRWDVVNDHPIYFRRPNGVLPMPTPEHGGSLDELRSFINVATDDYWMLLVAWLLGVFHPKGPYPVLAISGEHGTAKSSATRYLRDLVDPNTAPTREVTKEIGDLAIAAKNGRVIALDNLSHMSEWLADALCKMATGTGLGKRALYTNDEEILFNSRRPVIFNGIEELHTRGDLADRCLAVGLEPISGKARRTEEDLDTLWEAAKPRILGALLDAVVVALANRSRVKPDELPRMADFAVWVLAAEPHLGWRPGAFMAAYKGNKDEAAQLEVDASVTATAVRAFVKTQRGAEWRGKAEELLSKLKDFVPLERMPHFPQSPNALSGKLRRIAPALRSYGIDVRIGSSNGSRFIKLSHCDSDDQSDDLPIHSDDLGANNDESDDPQNQDRRWEIRNTPPTRANSNESDDLFGALSLSELLNKEEGEEEERVCEKGEEDVGKSSSLSSLLSLPGNGGYLPLDGIRPYTRPESCSLCGKSYWGYDVTREFYVCRNCHHDQAAEAAEVAAAEAADAA